RRTMGMAHACWSGTGYRCRAAAGSRASDSGHARPCSCRTSLRLRLGIGDLTRADPGDHVSSRALRRQVLPIPGGLAAELFEELVIGELRLVAALLCYA